LPSSPPPLSLLVSTLPCWSSCMSQARWKRTRVEAPPPRFGVCSTFSQLCVPPAVCCSKNLNCPRLGMGRDGGQQGREPSSRPQSPWSSAGPTFGLDGAPSRTKGGGLGGGGGRKLEYTLINTSVFAQTLKKNCYKLSYTPNSLVALGLGLPKSVAVHLVSHSRTH
jgi:hypothetical protein